MERNRVGACIAACPSLRKWRRVATASAWQVREPLYRRSVGRWVRYARHLEGLAARIGGPDETAP